MTVTMENRTMYVLSTLFHLKKPKKIIFKKQKYSCGAAQMGRDAYKSSTNLNPKVKCDEVLTMVGRKNSFPKYVI
jgi:hypothetical protein